jgi:hypothetical protein
MPGQRAERRQSQRRGQSPQPLPRQRQQKPVSRPTMMARERILSHLSDLIRACEELFEEHGDECCCDGCCLVSNAVGMLRIFRMTLEIT